MNISDVKEAKKYFEGIVRFKPLDTALELLTLFSEGNICEVATEEEIRAIMATIDPNPILSEYDKQVAKALLNKIPAHRYTEEALDKILDEFIDNYEAELKPYNEIRADCKKALLR